MRILRYSVVLGVIWVAAWTSTAQEIDGAAEEAPIVDTPSDFIVVCPVKGVIEPGVLVLIERAIREAEELNAKAIIFRVDTPGGRVDTAVEIAKVIGEAPFRTIAYIEGMGAISAGALISFACDDLIMMSSSNIGAATPVFQTSEGMEPAGEKSVSFMRAKMRALAESKGHNPDIAQAMVDKDIELRGYTDDVGEYVVYAVDSDGSTEATSAEPEVDPIQKLIDTVTEDLPIDVTITPKEDEEAEPKSDTPDIGTIVYDDGSELVLAKGKLLTLTPSESVKYGVIETTVESLDEAVTHYLLGGGTYHIIEPNWAEVSFRFLTSPTIAGLLLMLGMGGLYLEVRTPGFGFPGIVGITCLALLFGSHFVLGLADTIDLFLVVAGILLILAEIFVIPGFGIAGIAGMLCLVTGIYLSFVSFTFPQYSWDFDRLNDVAYSFAVFVISGFAFVAATWKLLPMTPFYGAMVLSDTMSTGAGYVGQDLAKAESVLGQVGTTLTPLRPVGKGRFGNEKLNIVTRGEFIESGVKVKILESDGNRYVVHAVDEEA